MFKIGLCLSGGAAKSYVFVGLLKALEKENIPISILTGTSAGAIIAAFFGLGYSAKEIEEKTLDLINWNIGSISLFPKKSLLDNKNLKAYFQKNFENKNLEDFKIPLQISTTDLIEGKEYIIKEGPLVTALLATTAFPGMYPPIKINDKLLVDGGVLNNTPTDILKRLGSDFIITMNTYPEPKEDDYDNLLKVIFRSYQIIDINKIDNSLKIADFVFYPDLEGIKLTSIKQGKYIIDKGEESFYKQSDDFKKKLRLKKIKKFLTFGIL